MNLREIIQDYPIHDSMRGHFGYEVFKAMAENGDIFVILPDLGWPIWDMHMEYFPSRVFQVGAAEQVAAGAAIGLALSDKIPVVYSITTFLLFRSFEWIRNYVNHEQIPVLLVGSGMDDDYAHDGITHQPWEAKEVLALFPNIKTYFPSDKTEIPAIVTEMIEATRPAFLCLRR